MLFENIGVLTLGSELKAISDRFYQHADVLYKSQGINFQSRWFPVIKTLQINGEQSISEIADEIGQTHSAVSQLSRKLMKAGLVSSRQSKEDERKRLLKLTNKAIDVVSSMEPIWKDLEQYLAYRIEYQCPTLLDSLKSLDEISRSDVCEDVSCRLAGRKDHGVEIVSYETRYKEDFRRLNSVWLDRYFEVETHDEELFMDPEGIIIDQGGLILFAKIKEKIVGTCALHKTGPGEYELCKMGVEPAFQALGIGRKLLHAIIEAFRHLEGKTLFLESSYKLPNALKLYEQMGFVLQDGRKPGSAYDRSELYMVWQP